ncbi:MAG: hypothetical protein KDK36_15095, partial [Leptospiraceae bacterium]|nr:hypothetical protein [Leptospiraceae bacterium]
VTKLNSNCSWFDSAHHANSSNNDKLEYYLRPMKQPHSELEGNSLPERSRRETNTKELNSPDYSKLKLTRSNYPIPFRITLIKHSEELFTIKWEDFTKRYDTISLIVFSPENEKYHKVEMPINENFWHIEIPEEFQTTTNYYYLYCYHSKRKTFSESINLTPEDGADILWKIHKLKRAVTAVTKDINHWSEDNAIEERDMLRFSLMFPLGYLRASFDMGNYQKIPPTNGFLYKREESEIKKRN